MGAEEENLSKPIWWKIQKLAGLSKWLIEALLSLKSKFKFISVENLMYWEMLKLWKNFHKALVTDSRREKINSSLLKTNSLSQNWDVFLMFFLRKYFLLFVILWGISFELDWKAISQKISKYKLIFYLSQIYLILVYARFTEGVQLDFPVYRCI